MVGSTTFPELFITLYCTVPRGASSAPSDLHFFVWVKKIKRLSEIFCWSFPRARHPTWSRGIQRWRSSEPECCIIWALAQREKQRFTTAQIPASNPEWGYLIPICMQLITKHWACFAATVLSDFEGNIVCLDSSFIFFIPLPGAWVPKLHNEHLYVTKKWCDWAEDSKLVPRLSKTHWCQEAARFHTHSIKKESRWWRYYFTGRFVNSGPQPPWTAIKLFIRPDLLNGLRSVIIMCLSFKSPLWV